MTPEQIASLLNSGKSLKEIEEMSKVQDITATSSSSCEEPLTRIDGLNSQVLEINKNIPTIQAGEVSLNLPKETIPSDENNGAAEIEVEKDTQLRVAPTGFQPTLTPIRRDGFDFKDPVELLFFLDDSVRTGKTKLHPWQIQAMLDFAKDCWTDEFPFQALARACNGSGKDKFLIAPCSVWLCMAFLRARAVITSSSGTQLDNQTDTHIHNLCESANRKIHPKVWKLNYRYYECLDTGSPMLLFATDEPGKAEGYHPIDTGCKMALFMSEAKTVPDSINTAFNKCTGYTHRFHVSTPDVQLGHFYEYCQIAPLRRDIPDITKKNAIDYIQYHITAFDCPHLSKIYVEQMKRDLPGGETGAAFMSQVLAEFASASDDLIVIPYIHVWNAVNKAQDNVGWIQEEHNNGGLDLADGGDETVLVVRNGNKVLNIIPFKFNNTHDTRMFLQQKFRENGLDHPRAWVFADAGNLGKGMVNEMQADGWSNLRLVWNQGKTNQPKVYKNKGAEMWFGLRKFLEKCELWIPNDKKLITQLGTRYYKLVGGLHQLESKLEARSKGRPSPDRADALVLCFSNYKTKIADESTVKPHAGEPLPETPKSPLTLQEVANRENYNSNVTLQPSRGKDFRVYKALIARHNQTIKENKV